MNEWMILFNITIAQHYLVNINENNGHDYADTQIYEFYKNMFIKNHLPCVIHVFDIHNSRK